MWAHIFFFIIGPHRPFQKSTWYYQIETRTQAYVSYSPSFLNLCKNLKKNVGSSSSFFLNSNTRDNASSVMAIYYYRSLKALIRNPKISRSFLTATTTTFSISAPPHAPLSNPLIHPLFRFPSQSSSRFLSPFSNWIVIPFHGPLFLSSQPWKLSQSATPLYHRGKGNGVVRRKIEALNLHLLRRRPSFPLKLEFVSVSANRTGSESVDSDRWTGAFVESFVNWPNVISMTRLISGPILGWYISMTNLIFFFFLDSYLDNVDFQVLVNHKGEKKKKRVLR